MILELDWRVSRGQEGGGPCVHRPRMEGCRKGPLWLSSGSKVGAGGSEQDEAGEVNMTSLEFMVGGSNHRLLGLAEGF